MALRYCRVDQAHNHGSIHNATDFDGGFLEKTQFVRSIRVQTRQILPGTLHLTFIMTHFKSYMTHLAFILKHLKDILTYLLRRR
jgi:hypothetical protein